MVSPGLCSGAISFLSSKAAVVGAGRWARLYTAGRGRRGGGLPALPLHHPTKKLPRRSSSPARPAARAHVPPPASHAAARGGERMIDRSIDRSSRARRLARSSGRGSRRGGVHRPAASRGVVVQWPPGRNDLRWFRFPAVSVGGRSSMPFLRAIIASFAYLRFAGRSRGRRALHRGEGRRGRGVIGGGPHETRKSMMISPPLLVLDCWCWWYTLTGFRSRPGTDGHDCASPTPVSADRFKGSRRENSGCDEEATEFCWVGGGAVTRYATTGARPRSSARVAALQDRSCSSGVFRRGDYTRHMD